MDQEQGAILAVAIMAALCDGQQDEAERRAVLALSLGGQEEIDTALQAVQSGTLRLDDVVRFIQSPAGRRLAYEAAAAVCTADASCNVAELAFLESLRGALGLGNEAAAIRGEAAAVAAAPLDSVAADAGNATPGGAPADAPAAAGAAADEAQLNRLIRDTSILTGALELLPQSLATLAVLPLQMRLVFRIGRAYGFELGREHIRDFIATLGVGLTAQYLDGFARRLLGGLLGGIGRQTASSGIAFVTTYAIGEAARRYYAGGRKLEAVQLRAIYQSMLADARAVAGQAQDEIQRRAAALRSGSLADLLRSA